MTCRQLGGPCDEKFQAENWDDMVQKMYKHVTDNHPETAKEMEEMYNKDPQKWGTEMKAKWEATSSD